MLSLIQSTFTSRENFYLKEIEETKGKLSSFSSNSSTLSYSKAYEGFHKARIEDMQLLRKVRIIRNHTIATISPIYECISGYDSNFLDLNKKYKLKNSSAKRKSSESSTLSDAKYDDLPDFFISNTQKVKCSKTTNKENKILFSVKMKELLKRVIDERNRAIHLIKKQIKIYLKFISEKKQKLINELLAVRKLKAILIQKYFRSFSVRKHIEEIKNCDYVFFYNYSGVDSQPNNNSKNKIIITSENLNKNSSELFHYNSTLTTNYEHFDYNNRSKKIKEIKIKFNKGKEGCEFLLKFSRSLNCYYFPFKKQGVMRKRFRVNFIVDGNTIIDPKFEVDNDNNGHFYNLIESSMFRKKKNLNLNMMKIHSPQIKPSHPNTDNNLPNSTPNNVSKTKKFWENIFEIKLNSIKENNSVSDRSEQSDAAIDRLMNSISNIKIHTPLVTQKNELEKPLPILKKKTENFRNSQKKVTFSDNVEYSY